MKSVKNEKRIFKICGIEFDFDYNDFEDVISKINNYPQKKLTAIFEAGYTHFYIFEDIYAVKRKLQKTGYKFDTEFIYEIKTIFTISEDRSNLIIDKETDLCGVFDYLYGIIPYEVKGTYKGIKVIFKTTNKVAGLALDILAKLPECVLKEFSSQDCTFYLLNKDEFNKKSGKDEVEISGYYNHCLNEIVIKEYDNKDVLENVIYHEFGHFIDICTCIKDTSSYEIFSEFYELYLEMKDYLLGKADMYYLSNPFEFFAYISYLFFSGKSMNKRCYELFKKRLVALSAKV